MNEDFLVFVWQYQQLEPSRLITTCGEQIQVIKTGIPNTNAGPDFTGARLLIDNIEWVGCVEVHFRSSEWNLHKHQIDKSYESVILHIVWEDDQPVFHQNGALVTTLVLNDKLHPGIRDKYDNLLAQSTPIPCGQLFVNSPEIYKINMRERLMLERLARKSDEVLLTLHESQNDWEETTYQFLLRYYGGVVNAEAFSRLTKVLPWKILRKHCHNLLTIEALLFGSAGLLPTESENEYIAELIREYTFLSKKYNLEGRQMGEHEWKFLRIRPVGFPTTRIAQLAVFLHQHPNLFSFFSTTDLENLRNNFKIKQSEYWQQHFKIGEKSKNTIPPMGKLSADLLIINVVIPVLVGYNRYQGKEIAISETVWSWLEILPPENNRILRIWQSLDMKIVNAFDSQALIEWYSRYCQKKKCLNCGVGNYLLRN